MNHWTFQIFHLQLNDVELSCLLKVVLELVEMVGGQNVLRGTDIHPVFSPSRARASSKMNFPSANVGKRQQNYSRFSPTANRETGKIIIIHNDVSFRANVLFVFSLISILFCGAHCKKTIQQ
jgi:hypothetical protein